MSRRSSTRSIQPQREISADEDDVAYQNPEAEELPLFERDVDQSRIPDEKNEDGGDAFAPIFRFVLYLYYLQYLHLLFIIGYICLIICKAIDWQDSFEFLFGASLLIPLPLLILSVIDASTRFDQRTSRTILGIPYLWMLPLADISGEDNKTRISATHMFPLYVGLYFTGVATATVAFAGPGYHSHDVAIFYLTLTDILLYHDHYNSTGVRTDSFLTGPDSLVRVMVGFMLMGPGQWIAAFVQNILLLARVENPDWPDWPQYWLAAISIACFLVIWEKISNIWKGKDWVSGALYREWIAHTQESLERRASNPETAFQPAGPRPKHHILSRKAISSAPARSIRKPSHPQPPSKYDWHAPPSYLPAHRQPRRLWGESLANTLPRLAHQSLHLLYNLLKVQLIFILFVAVLKLLCILVGTCTLEGPASWSSAWEWFKSTWLYLWGIDRRILGREWSIGGPLYFWVDWGVAWILVIILLVLDYSSV